MKVIYNYTNVVNGKTYVGQTNNQKRRIREHRSSAFNEKSTNHDSVFHRAIRKYGYDAFEYEVLESGFDSQEEIDERERFWIREKRSLVSQDGYNILEGGKGTFWNSSHTKEEIDLIKQNIKKGTSYNLLTKKYKISKSFLSHINHGIYFFDSKETYPLYEHGLSDKCIATLVKHLKESKLTFKQIAQELDLSDSTVKKINYGELRPNLSDDYPIRKLTPQNRRANETKDFLTNTLYTYTEISNKVGVSHETVRRINLGITNKDKLLQYPLRDL